MADQHNANIPALTNTIASDVPDIKENLEYHKDVFQAFVNAWSDTVATNVKPKIMGDADNDTLIQCEEGSDEDIIRFDIGGTEQVTIQDGKIEPTTANDVDLGSAEKEFKNLYLEGSITIDDVAQGKDTTAALHTKILEIGDWNMDSTAYVDIAHGLTQANIRVVQALVRSDEGSSETWRMLSPYSGIYYEGASVGDPGGGISAIGAVNIRLFRSTGGVFDSTDFNATSYNRGWITIWYV